MSVAPSQDNPPAATHPTLPELVDRQVTARPDAVAVVDGATRLSYRELQRRANVLAHELVRLGVGTDTRVAVAVPRSAGFVVAALAVLEAGGAYVPVDPNYPPQRQEFMLADCGGAVLLRTAAGPGPHHVPGLVVDVTGPEPTGPEADRPPRTCSHPDQLAYVIYTSGSTGTPKGVAITHRNVVDLLTSDPRLAVAADQSVVHLAPTAFDASTFEIWAALAAGARIEVLAEAQLSARELGDRLRERRPGWLFLTTGLFHLLVDADPDALRAVGVLVTGGDVLSGRHVRTAAGLVADRLYAAYGPTENTVYSALHLASAEEPDGAVPLGTALAGRAMRVVGADLAAHPVGRIGEVVLTGAGLARGYHDRPALTAERFRPDPDGPPGSRLYLTGDRGRLLPNGEIEFLGRMDRQVKIRGFRVELGEIEVALAAHPQVAAAAVAAVTEDAGKRLVAYAADNGRGDLQTGPLRSWLADRLPDHLLPANLVVLKELPLDPNGKVDRTALPTPWLVRAKLENRELPELVPPSNRVQRLLAEAFVDSLGIDEVGVHDNFFVLGGDSLRTVGTIAHLRANGLLLSSRDFFLHPTIAELAELARVEDPTAAGSGVPLVPIEE